MEGFVKLFELSQLPPGGSVRFALGWTRGPFGPVQQEGFAVRTPDGLVRAYLNVCPHRGQPVDLGDGRMWAPSGEIECAAHGARFDPATGGCKGGPCDGRALTPLEVREQDGALWLAAARI